MHTEAKSDEFLDVGKTFWRVCPPPPPPPATSETDFLDPPVRSRHILMGQLIMHYKYFFVFPNVEVLTLTSDTCQWFDRLNPRPDGPLDFPPPEGGV